MAADDDDYLLSSQLSASGTRRRSKFTFKQLSQLAQYSTVTPLRVIAHVDLDAFYAQCESIRLGLPETQPLAVQQWTGLIAVNYPARNKGISRFLNIGEAKKLCPDVILQHVATWKEGDEKWQYHGDAFGEMATHKVSLDPYRANSRQILACIKESLPAGAMQRVEKAGIDEVFLDLSAQVHSILLQRYPELKGPAPYDDPTENLPRPPISALDWATDALIDLDEHHTEDDDPDWDDIAMCVASEIVRGVRARIRETLKFTCSAGVAKNKMLAKLGSAHKKPNNQTIVRNRAVQQFLSDFKFTKIRNLGGKLGDQVAKSFQTELVSELLKIPLQQLKLKIGDDTGSWVYSVIRGEDSSEVNSRTQIKSMLSAKSFVKPINTQEQAERWLRIFIADIFSRLVEEGVLENKRRPKTMNLHYRQGGQTWSRQMPIPQGKTISEPDLFDISKNLLQQIILEGRVWPCSNLSLSVTGFEDGPAGNRGIGGFLLKGEEAQNLNTSRMQAVGMKASPEPPAAKKRKLNGGGELDHFFRRQESNEDVFRDESPSVPRADSHNSPVQVAGEDADDDDDDLFVGQESTTDSGFNPGSDIDVWVCPKCYDKLDVLSRAEHEDWHFAKELQASENSLPPAAPPSATSKAKPGGKPPAKKSQPKAPGKGQMKLAFK